MCGINGFTYADEVLIRSMNRETLNRGPDSEGVLVDEYVSLGHCRLAIIDLSPKGHQPMANEDKTIWIVYNGEIYNFQEIREELVKKGHVFNSRTDTEVVIHAYEEWGAGCLDIFNGMWAFCIYDQGKGELILCRDRFGIKPLYYYMDSEKLIFSSMIAGILCHDVQTEPNEKIIMQFLLNNLEDHSQETFFNNIHQLEPGTLLAYNLRQKKPRITKWYIPKHHSEVGQEAIRHAFIESVKLRTIADVPIGSCLSGGVDSSAIVCVLDKYIDYPFDTFSFVSPGFPKDETKYIEEIGSVTKAGQFFTRMTEDDFLDEIDDFVVSLEEPVLGLSPYAQFRVMKRAHEQGAKVLLDGQGGDEIFAGYVYYFSYLYLDLFRKTRWIKLCREMIQTLYNFKTFFPMAMFAFMMLPSSWKTPARQVVSNRWVNKELLGGLANDTFDPRWRKMSLDEALNLTLSSTAIPHLLRWEDKNAMRWSIESRLPFLDVNLVELARSLPAQSKLKNGQTKVIFKRAIIDILPEMIRARKDKIGFETPVDDFFRGPKIAEFCKDIIYSVGFKNRPYWKWKDVEKMFLAHVEHKRNCGKEIWKWINLEMWLRQFFRQ